MIRLNHRSNVYENNLATHVRIALSLGFLALIQWGAPSPARAATVWTGAPITFVKPNNADWTQPGNQDRITPNVWLTRAATLGLFNIKTEGNFSHSLSPADTEWAAGTTANFATLTYTDWETWAKSLGGPPSTPGKNAVLHLKSEDIYIDIKFISWSARIGGGFSYERSTPAAASNSPPTVAITSPTNGASLTAPATVTIQATASDSDGTVTNVQFFDGAASLGNDASSPFSLATNLTAGTHTLTAVATDNQGATNRSALVTIIIVATNVPPSVAITSPTNNTSFPAGTAITIQATASDSDGSVTNVEFFDGSTLLARDSTSPYSITTNLAAGTHTLTAVATDNQGATNRSAVVTIIIVAANVPPSVAITSPTNNTSFPAGIAITIQATASDSDGSVTNVEFFDGSTLLARDSTSPYSITTNLAAGTHTLTAVATDNQGATNRSSAVTINVIASNSPPIVAITSPTNGASFTSPATVTITATATDSDGTVTNVQFFDGTTSLGNDANSPFSLSINLPAGSHSLTAVATDNQGATNRSAAVAIAVVVPVPIQISSIVSTNLDVICSWTGGLGPFALQKKLNGDAPTWINVNISTQSTARVPADRSLGIFRVADTAHQPAIPLSAYISGANERPAPLTNSAIGFGMFSLEDNTLTFDIRYSGLSGPATMGHIHGAATTATSTGIQIDFAPFNGSSYGSNGTVSGSVTVTDAQKAMVLAGQTYVNFHTALNPGGEMRGQIAPVLMQVALNSANENPPVPTSGSGLGIAMLVSNQLTFNITYRGLSGAATMAHFHGPATNSTQNVAVLVDLQPFNGGAFGSSGTLAGTVALTPAQLAMMIDGQTYVNFHTAANPGGEIRGQLVPQATAVPMTALVSGLFERPTPVTNSASGSAFLSLEGDRLAFSINYSGLSGPATMAHIHGAANSAQSVGVQIDFAQFNGGSYGSNGTVAGSVLVTSAQRDMLLSGQTYVNFHTTANPGGEIRGQVAPVLMRSSLSGANERPDPVSSSGAASGIFALVLDKLAFDLTYRGLTSSATDAHIHAPADVTQSANVIVPLGAFNGGAFGTSGSVVGTVTLTPSQMTNIIDQLSYVNIHTTNFPGGEIRGQLVR